MSFDGLFTFYYRIKEGIIDYDCIKNQSIKNVTKDAFDVYEKYIKMNNLTKSTIITGSNVWTRDCEFHEIIHDSDLNKMKVHKNYKILFNDIQNKDKVEHLSTEFLYLRLDSSDNHIMKPYKNFINIIQPKFVLLNYNQNKVPISSCDPEMQYYVDPMDEYKIINKGACKTGQYYDIISKYCYPPSDFECYYVEYVLLLERII